MNPEESFDNSTYADEMHVEESELSAFVNAVKGLFGSAQARLAAQDWLDESELMDSPPRSTSRDWRAVTIAASARLADRLNVGLQGGAARRIYRCQGVPDTFVQLSRFVGLV